MAFKEIMADAQILMAELDRITRELITNKPGADAISDEKWEDWLASEGLIYVATRNIGSMLLATIRHIEEKENPGSKTDPREAMATLIRATRP